jgi:hypothetical protein
VTHSFRLNGHVHQLDTSAVRAALKRELREDIREHWIEVDGVRWPVKQVFGAATALPREQFTAHVELVDLTRLLPAIAPAILQE